MPEVELREALHRRADDVMVVDLVDRVAHGHRVRHRRRLAAATGTTAVVTAGIVIATLVVTGSAAGRHPGESPGSGTPRPGTPRSTTSITPAYLPPGVTFAGLAPSLFPVPHGFTRTTSIDATYRLPGVINRDTVPRRRYTPSPGYHTSTGLSILFASGMKSLPPPAGPGGVRDSKLFRRIIVRVAGNRAVVTQGRQDAHDIRVDWIDPAGYHLVQCEGLTTSRGLSGLPLATILRIARSLYQPAATPSPTSGPADATYYPSVGVTLTPAPPRTSRVISEARARRIFRTSAFYQHRRFTVRLDEFSQGFTARLMRGPELAWVVTEPHARVASYRPAPVPSGEPLVMVIDAHTGKTLEVFAERPQS